MGERDYTGRLEVQARGLGWHKLEGKPCRGCGVGYRGKGMQWLRPYAAPQTPSKAKRQELSPPKQLTTASSNKRTALLAPRRFTTLQARGIETCHLVQQRRPPPPPS